MRTFDFDLFVIGGGSGGVRAARMAGADRCPRGAGRSGRARRHLRQRRLHSQEALQLRRRLCRIVRGSAGYGWHVAQGAAVRLGHLKTQRAKEITRLNGVYGSLLDAGRHARHRLGAAGRRPHGRDRRRHSVHRAPHPGGHRRHGPSCPTCRAASACDRVRRHVRPRPVSQALVMVGGGYIACEFASIFNGLGAQVTQLQRRRTCSIRLR
jgi:glutathione reductase (NADPH)